MGNVVGYALTAVAGIVVGAVGHAYFSNAAAKAVAAIESDFARLQYKVGSDFEQGVHWVLDKLKKL